ncbi:MAG: diguanylate cyclase [Solirubrobacteraceae bacterium]|nr:diguanylate cyclase [Solirubrobacteraceae bacterium]
MLVGRVRKLGWTGALVANVGLAIFISVRRAPVHSQQWDYWFTNALMLAPIVACVVRAGHGGSRGSGAAWLAAAMTCYAAGNVIFVGWTQYQAHPPVPSPADLAYLGFYPCVGMSALCLLRRDGLPPTKGLWLDGALGAAGAATALAAILSPVLVSTGSDLGTVVMGASFAVADLLLIAVVVGVLAVRGLGDGSMWLWLGAGLGVFCAADVTYALHVASGTFVVGTPWTGLWVIGLCVAAMALWRPERGRAAESGRSVAMLVIPGLATVTAVTVLVISSIAQLGLPVIGLATLTLALAGARNLNAFSQVRRLSDAHRQAITDELTGFGNRRGLFEHGAERLAQGAGSDRLALMLIDLDDFKQFNDSLGHAAGDELLRETARRLAIRVSYPDLLVRLGGDEFALLFSLSAGEDARVCAERILDRVGQPVMIDSTRIRVDASAGIVETRGSDTSVPELLRRADVALYAAKAGGARVEYYDPHLDEANRARLETVHDLDAAIVHSQFVLHYQPKIDIDSGAIVGVEALVRWQHPTRGLLYPDAFLPLVEQSGLMAAMTRIVLRTAVQQVAAWRTKGIAIRVAVNLSASDLLDDQLAERIIALLSEYDVPVDSLELEVTESVLMTDPERARAVLERLKRLGLRLAVDDYGTGYCALSYLRDLPIDVLKIDRSFISRMADDTRSAAIVCSTIELAHALGLAVVAEGVEHQPALDTLVSFGCDLAQGYHFGRPVPAPDLTDQLPVTPGLVTDSSRVSA